MSIIGTNNNNLFAVPSISKSIKLHAALVICPRDSFTPWEPNP